MAGDKNQKHAHKYLRVKLGKNDFEVYKCILPGCGHFIQKDLVLGKRAICWRCGAEITMNSYHSQFKKPHCRECTAQDGRSKVA